MNFRNPTFFTIQDMNERYVYENIDHDALMGGRIDAISNDFLSYSINHR